MDKFISDLHSIWEYFGNILIIIFSVQYVKYVYKKKLQYL